MGTFVAVLFAAVLKTVVIPHLKQYYSLAQGHFLLWCQNNWQWKTLRYFIYMTTHLASSSSG